MPERLAVTEATDRLAVFDDVRDDRDLRRGVAAPAFVLGSDTVLLLDQRCGRELELPELASERHVLFVAQRLLAKPHNEIVEPGAADRVALEQGKRTANVNATDVGAEPGRERQYRNGHCALLRCH